MNRYLNKVRRRIQRVCIARKLLTKTIKELDAHSEKMIDIYTHYGDYTMNQTNLDLNIKWRKYHRVAYSMSGPWNWFVYPLTGRSYVANL
jgi:hypothetical protein